MIHQNALMAARIRELEELNNELTKRKSRKRKQIQSGEVLKFGETSQAVAAESPSAQQSRKKPRGGADQDRAQPAQRRCGKCGETGHNTRTCSFVEEEISKADAST
jgi:hypothetical protein